MRTLREVLVILGTVALVAFAGHGLALASAELSGGIDGWEGVVAGITAGLATFVALVASTLATLVVRRRGWRIAFLAVTLVGVVYLALGAFSPARASSEVLGEAAIAVSLALALWLPVGARWWLDHLATGPTASTASAESTASTESTESTASTARTEGTGTAPGEPHPAVSRRSAVVAGVACAAAGLVAVGISLSLAGSSLPRGLAGFVLVLVATAALSSGRVPDVMALALLAGVAVCAVLFGLPALPDGGLVTAALAVVVLVAFSWRPFAARLTAARRAAVPELPVSPRAAPSGDARPEPSPSEPSAS